MKRKNVVSVVSKIAIVALTATVAASLAACSNGSGSTSSSANTNQSSSAVNSSTSSSAENPAMHTVGGWTVEKANNAILTKEQKEIFEKAAAATDIIIGQPIAAVGSQVVAGTNWMYLCTHEENGVQTGWDMAVVYQDLQDGAVITSDVFMDIANLPILATPTGALAGGWTSVEPTPGLIFTDEEEKAWNEAMDAQGDIEMIPMAVLGTQVVAGTNYKVLGYGKLDRNQEQYGIYVATIYAPVDDSGATFTDISLLDLSAFSGQ